MANPKELTIFSNWLEEKLKVHFVKKSQVRNPTWGFFQRQPKFSTFLVVPKPNQGNGVAPIQATVSDFRILDFKMEKNEKRKKKSKQYTNGNLPYNDNLNDHFQVDHNDPHEMSPRSIKKSTADEPYQKHSSHETSQSIGKELWLHLQAWQIVDVESTESIISKYELCLDEHEIDVYTKVFPSLKYWVPYKKSTISLPVPECYYGGYETEELTKNSGMVDSDELDDDDNVTAHLFEDDIMSKVAAGLEFFERDRRKREKNAGKQSNYRLLILEDVSRQGFKVKNVGPSSTFLSLLNVEEAVKSLARIHSVSWAFAQVSGRSLLKTWPFLNNPLYLPYLKERVIPGFSSMERLVQAYLFCSGKETVEMRESILNSLTKLGLHLADILVGLKHPRTVKCLIHQSACFSNFLFKYSVLTTKQKKSEQEKWKGHNTKAGDDDDNYNYGGKEDKNNNNSLSSSLSAAPLDSKKDYDVITKAQRGCLEKELSREVMLINWRTASVGSPMIDVAFLLLTALPPKTRRAETAALLRIYWNSFRMYAEKFGLSLRWSDAELYEDYLAALLYTCVLITGNITGSQCELNDEGMQVFIEALKDLMSENMI